MKIEIEVSDDGGLEVRVGDKTSGPLTVGEMLEQVLGLSGRQIKTYPMLTAEEWERRWKPREQPVSEEEHGYEVTK